MPGGRGGPWTERRSQTRRAVRPSPPTPARITITAFVAGSGGTGFYGVGAGRGRSHVSGRAKRGRLRSGCGPLGTPATWRGARAEQVPEALLTAQAPSGAVSARPRRRPRGCRAPAAPVSGAPLGTSLVHKESGPRPPRRHPDCRNQPFPEAPPDLNRPALRGSFPLVSKLIMPPGITAISPMSTLTYLFS